MPETNIITVNSLNYEDEVLQSKLPVFVDVSATWCGPCKAAAPIVREIAARYQGKLKVVEIDGGESPELVARLGVRGFPTFLGFANGEAQHRIAGFGGKAPLLQLAERLVNS